MAWTNTKQRNKQIDKFKPDLKSSRKKKPKQSKWKIQGILAKKDLGRDEGSWQDMGSLALKA